MRGFIQEIFDAAETPASLLEELVAEAQNLVADTDAVGAILEEQQAAVEQMSSEISEQMNSVRESIAAEQERLESRIETTSAEAEELKSTIDDVTEEISSALEVAQQQMEEFRGHVESGREMVEAANQAAQGVISQVQEHINTGREALEGATDFANDQVDALQGRIDETFQATEQFATQLIDDVETGLRDVGSKVEEMTGVSFEELHSGFSTAMELVQGNVFENGVNMALDQLQTMIQDELNSVIDRLLELFVETMANVRESLFGKAEESGLERQMLEPILDQLDTLLSPLFDAVDHIKSLAEMVGIDV